MRVVKIGVEDMCENMMRREMQIKRNAEHIR